MEKLDYRNFFDLTSFQHQNLFKEGKPVWETLLEIEPFLKTLPLGKIYGKIDEKAVLVNPESIYIGKGTVVEAGVLIHGPCAIGEECQIRHGAYIRGNVILANRCVVGHATEVKNAIFLDSVHAGHFAYIGNSILGNRVNLGAGTKCANLRFDGKNVSVNYEGKKIDTGLRKFGAVLGDEAQTGCNSVTNPGTILGKKSCIFPCVNVSGYIPNDSIIKTSGNKGVLVS